MIKYIFFKSYENLPKEEKVLNFVYDKSFVKDEYSGSYFYSRENPIAFRLHWPKWVDNKNIPDYTRYAFINVIFPPLHTRDIRFSNDAVKRAKDLKYKYCAVAYIGNEKHQILRHVAFIDLCIFHRTVFLFAKNLEGVIWNTKNKKVVSHNNYFKNYKRFIEARFSRKLDGKYLKMIRAAL
jgi:hypothetical protein